MKEFAEELAVALLHNPFGESVRGRRPGADEDVKASCHGCCTLPLKDHAYYTEGPGATIKGSTCFDTAHLYPRRFAQMTCKVCGSKASSTVGLIHLRM